jgi:hypothetical protein
MKKILFTIALTITLGLTSSAQFNNTDAFFNNWEQSDRLDLGGGFSFVLPTAHGFGNDYTAPLGSGLLVLTALGAGYAVKYRRKK